MKPFSKALAALSFLAAATAAHAQTSYFGTNFDGSTTYPYTDGTIYTAAPDTASAGAELNGQGGWAVNSNGFGQVFTGGGNTFALLQSAGVGGVTATHALNTGTVGGFYFNTDFAIADTGAGNAPGNSYAFSFNNAAGNVFSVNFLATPQNGGTTDGAPTPQLVQNGVVVATASQGPVLDKFFHLSVSVSNIGAVSATLTSLDQTIVFPLTTLNGPVPLLGDANAITSVSIVETSGGATSGTDFVQFDNLSVVVPEPSTYAMMGLGLLGMLGVMKFRRIRA